MGYFWIYLNSADKTVVHIHNDLIRESFARCNVNDWLPILIIASASPDASADKSAAEYSENVGWRVTFKAVNTLTGSSSLAGRPFEEQPHELYRK